MKLLKLFVLFFMFSLLIFAQEKKLKVGLLLSGGGARGLGHIGVLKMIDSLQIPIDYVVGTSMGGIIGALYASGYSGAEIEKFSLSNDWESLFSDKPQRINIPYLQKKDDAKYQLELGIKGFTPIIPSGLISGQNVFLKFTNLISFIESVHDFDKLPIPFRCVAVDLISGKEVVLKKGSLAKAMRATMSIPTVFSPVDWGDSLLVDGGILNNFPADVLKEMGADLIIGVNVGTPLKSKEELNSMLSVLEQTMILTDFEKQNINKEICDVFIRPDLASYTSSDFETEKVAKIIEMGNISAQENKQLFIEFIKKHKLKKIDSAFKNISDSITYTINNIEISGNQIYDSEYYLSYIEFFKGDTLDIHKLRNNLSSIKTLGIVESIELKITKTQNELLDLIISVKEKETYFVHGISIHGNENLPFNFIFDLLNLKITAPFNKLLIEENIQKMFSLGYFELISYTLTPIKNNYFHINLTVKEQSMRKLRIGFRYDDHHKIVGIIGLQATNLPFAGLRTEINFQYAGLLKFDAFTFYPTRTLNFPIFPYLRISYKNIPLNLYSYDSGIKFAEYSDQSWTFAGGFAFNLSTIGLLKFDYNHEYVNIKPQIESVSPELFPIWKDKLVKINSSLSIDLLDDAISPTNGVKIESEIELSLKALKSDLEYYQYKIDAFYYKTLFNNHTLRLNAFYTNFNKDLPSYKYPYKGGIDSFIGVDVNQLFGNKFSYLRFDYIYKYKKDIFLKFIVNACYMNLTDSYDNRKYSQFLYGIGAGIKFLSIIGPFEIVYSKGSQSIKHWNKFETRIYFSAGYYF